MTGNSRNRQGLTKRLAIWLTRISFQQTDDDGIWLQLICFPCTLTFNNSSDSRMSSSPAYPPWWRLPLPTHACQLCLTNHTWTFPRYQTNNPTVAPRLMHDGWSIAFMKSINHDQTWRQKSHEMLARKWLKSSVAATIQLFHVSKSWSLVPVFTWNADQKP